VSEVLGGRWLGCWDVLGERQVSGTRAVRRAVRVAAQRGMGGAAYVERYARQYAGWHAERPELCVDSPRPGGRYATGLTCFVILLLG
jgi:hypothetical protein